MRAAAIQALSRNGEADRNLSRAGELVGAAFDAGAELVVCPEFLAPGYDYSERAWASAEPRNGRTETWLLKHGKRGIVGAGWLEVDGEDFFNTYTLAGPDGILGRVRKRSAPACEGWVCGRGDGPAVVDTPLGRIAVGICNDNHLASFFNDLRNARFDLVVMPHSAPVPPIPLLAGTLRTALPRVAELYAQAFEVPVVMCNKAQGARWWMKIPLVPGLRLPMDFEGGSGIYQPGGALVASLSAGVGIVAAEVYPAPNAVPPPCGGFFCYPSPGPRLWKTLEQVGSMVYKHNKRRRLAAIARSQQTSSEGA